jgi:hypothetical protein
MFVSAVQTDPTHVSQYLGWLIQSAIYLLQDAVTTYNQSKAFVAEPEPDDEDD